MYLIPYAVYIIILLLRIKYCTTSCATGKKWRMDIIAAEMIIFIRTGIEDYAVPVATSMQNAHAVCDLNDRFTATYLRKRIYLIFVLIIAIYLYHTIPYHTVPYSSSYVVLVCCISQDFD